MTDTPSPRFCEQCGLSLVPLTVPHVARDCVTCGKTVHVVESGEGGRGIKVREGDRFTIPAGWLSMSLDPRRSTGRFARPGLSWFVRAMLTGDVPATAGGLEDLLAKWEKAADDVIENSARLKEFDLEDEGDANRAIETLKGDLQSVEWWAFVVGAFCKILKEKMDAGEAREASFAAIRLATSWSMLVFQRDLEEHVWTGYNQSQLIYGIAQAGAQTPAEAQAIAALEPIFKMLSEDVLHAWVESGVDIGPRIGVSGVAEELLKALARFHLSQFERQRSDKQLARENRAKLLTIVASAFSAGAAVAGAVVVVLKATGVL